MNRKIRMNNRKIFFLSSLLLLSFFCQAQESPATWKGDTLFINTTAIGAEYHGYNGITPVVIAIHNRRVVSVTPLPNRETRSYFSMLKRASFFTRWNGLTVEKALEKHVDAVSGATYSSEAVAGNVRAGLYLALETLGEEKKSPTALYYILPAALAIVLCGIIFLLIKKSKKKKE